MSFILLGILNAQAEAAGGAGAYDLLETQVLSSPATSVTFTGLGSYSDYKHLQIRTTMRTSNADGFDYLKIRLNSDSANNYAYHSLIGGGGVFSLGVASTDYIRDFILGDNAPSGSFYAGVYDILDFSSTSKNTTLKMLSGRVVGTSLDQIQLTSGLHVDTSAMTEILFEPRDGANFVTGSRFSLYGIK